MLLAIGSGSWLQSTGYDVKLRLQVFASGYRFWLPATDTDTKTHDQKLKHREAPWSTYVLITSYDGAFLC